MEKMYEQLVEEVRVMRLAQKEYFRTREAGWLREAQKREKIVDKAIEEFNQPKLI